MSVYDINEQTLEIVSRGRMPFKEEGAAPLLEEALASGRLILSSSPEAAQHADALIITIGTPVDEFLNPTLSLIKGCVDQLLPFMSDRQLIILRSTVFPGVTEWIERHLRAQGKSPRISFCPERVVQGLAITEIQQHPQIVSGTTPEAEDAAADLFLTIAPEVVRLTPMEAEFAKLFTNAYRYIQFAVANQFYMMANAAGVDFYRLLEGMKRNYPRARDIPRAGFAAGPCLFKDTMQLAAYSHNEFGLGHSAMLVNEGLVLHLAEDIEKRYPIHATTVGLLGMAFKSGSDDTRSSLSYKLKRALRFKAKRVLTTDPHVTTDRDLLPFETVVEQSDVLVLCTPHPEFLGVDYRGKPVIDVWGVLPRVTEPGGQPAC